MFVSVVMPSFNQARFISEAIDSVLKQDWSDLELIVMDGGSSDETTEILQDYASRDKRLLWKSELDRGPANAINKALQLCQGTLIGWLNSDDRYVSGAISRAVSAMDEHPGWLMCYGKGRHIDEKGHILSDYPTLPDTSNSNTAIPHVSTFQQGCFICQPTVFFKSVVRTMLGPLSEQLKCAFDFDYWLKAFNGFEDRIGFIPEYQAESRLHSQTITSRMRQQVALEGMQVLKDNLGYSEACWIKSYIAELESKAEKSNLTSEVTQIINAARDYLDPGDWSQLQKQYLKNKKRLQ